MPTVEEMLTQRKIPDVLRLNDGKAIRSSEEFEKRREEMKKLLCENEYGFISEKPDHLKVEVIKEDTQFCAGKAYFKKLNFILTFGESEFSFPVYEVTPKISGKKPAFIHINFRKNVPDEYMPSEEICDRGFAVFSFCHKDITSDDGNFKNGIAKHFINGKRKAADPGKIAMWAYAAMRVMDYIEALDYIDGTNIAVIGHSRLGKSALLTGAFDERFKYAISNDAGCSCTAKAKGMIGEQTLDMSGTSPFLFSTRCEKAVKPDDGFSFDRHFLFALIVPRHIMIGSAEFNMLSDSESEFVSLALANKVYKLYGKQGLVCNENALMAGTVLSEGDAHYHIRHGEHYLSREDWNLYMDFIEKRIG